MTEAEFRQLENGLISALTNTLPGTVDYNTLLTQLSTLQKVWDTESHEDNRVRLKIEADKISLERDKLEYQKIQNDLDRKIKKSENTQTKKDSDARLEIEAQKIDIEQNKVLLDKERLKLDQDKAKQEKDLAKSEREDRENHLRVEVELQQLQAKTQRRLARAQLVGCILTAGASLAGTIIANRVFAKQADKAFKFEETGSVSSFTSRQVLSGIKPPKH